MKNKLSMRILHRYLGYFLSGIMIIYALSGIVLIFRDTDFLKTDQQFEEKFAPQLTNEELGKELRYRDFKVTKEAGDIVTYKNGTYNKKTGVANYTEKDLPFVLNKLTHLHKASTDDPLYYLNIFFGCSLLFFVISAFWMYMPKTTIFKKGILFALVGVVLTLVLLFV